MVSYTVDDFFPLTGKKVSKEIKSLCKRCPVNQECLDHALVREKYGTWGALSEREREIERTRRGIKCIPPQTL